MSDAPRWSVVVPTFGRGAALAALLDALARLISPPGGFEVVIVDDGGPVPLDEIVDAHRATLDITLHRQANQGPAAARNAGVALARGVRIALTDDDCRPAVDWLTAFDEILNTTSGALVGGQTINGLTDNLFAASSQLLVDYLYACDRDGPDVRFVASNNMAMARADFVALDGFDAHFPLAAGEDRDFCDRWRERIGAIVIADGARVAHFHAMDARGFWRQHRNYGRGAVRVHARRRAEVTGPRFQAPGFYVGLVGYPLIRGESRAARKALLLAVSQLATTAGYVRERLARTSRRD